MRRVLVVPLLVLAVLVSIAGEVHGAAPWGGAVSVTTINVTNLGWTQTWEPYGFYDKAQYWIFYENNEVNCGGSQLNCLDYQCSSDGVSFAKTVVGVRVEDRMYSLYTNGTYIFYVRANGPTSTTNKALLFRQGKFGSGCAITWSAEQTVQPANSGWSFDSPTVALDTGGQAFVTWTNVTSGGSKYPYVWHSSGTNYASWTGQTQLNTTAVNTWFTQLVQLPSAQMYVAYWTSSGSDLAYGSLYNSAWGTTEKITTDKIGDRPAFLDVNGATPSFLYEKSGSGGYHYFTTRTAGSWATPGVIAQISNNHPWLDTVFYEANETKYHWINYDFGSNTIVEFTTGAANTVWDTGPIIFSTANSNSSMATNAFWGPLSSTQDTLGLVWVQGNPGTMYFSAATLTVGVAPPPPPVVAPPAAATCYPCAFPFQSQTVTTPFGPFTVPVQLLAPYIFPAVLFFSAFVFLSSLIGQLRIPIISTRRERRKRRSSLV